MVLSLLATWYLASLPGSRYGAGPVRRHGYGIGHDQCEYLHRWHHGGDLFDTKTKKLVWRGIAKDTLSTDPKKNANKIVKATEKMFKKNFPPGVASKK